MKKKLLQAGFLIWAISLTACIFPSQSDKETVKASSSAALSSAASSKPEKSKKDPGTVITVMGPERWIRETEKECAETFRKQTGIRVKFNSIPDARYEQVLLKKAEKGKLSDIYLAYGGPSMGSAVRVGGNAMSGFEPAGYLPEAEKMTSVDGTNYGMAYDDTDAGYYMVYNKRLFAAAGIGEFPATFEELKRDCEVLKSIGITPIYEPALEGWHTALLFTETSQMYEAEQPGLSVRLNNNTEKFADNPQMLQALGQLRELAEAGAFGESFISDSCTESYDRLAAGDYAMCMMRPGEISAIVASGANETGYAEEDFGIGILPLNDNDIMNVRTSVATRFINPRSKKQKYAMKYLEFLASGEQVQEMIARDPMLTSLPFTAGRPKKEGLFYRFKSGFDEYSVKNVMGDKVVYLNEQMSEISTDIASLLLGDMRPEDVLKAIDSRRTVLATRAGDPAWE